MTRTHATSPETETVHGIVVGVDGSPQCDKAARWAAQEASARNLPIVLAGSYILPQFLYAEGMAPSRALVQEMEENVQDSIDRAAEVVRAVDDSLEIIEKLRAGSPIPLLLKYSRTATMLVVGSRGLGGVAGALLGSVSASLVGHARCPVVVLRDDMEVAAMSSDSPIVVGIDGSPISDLAVRHAFEMAKDHRCGLVAVNAWLDRAMQSTIATINLSAADWQRAHEEQERMVNAVLAPFIEEYPDVPVTVHVKRESPELSLAEVGKDARLIVVGSHGRGGFAGMLLGSTSRALLRLSPQPLMVVRGHRHQHEQHAREGGTGK